MPLKFALSLQHRLLIIRLIETKPPRYIFESGETDKRWKKTQDTMCNIMDAVKDDPGLSKKIYKAFPPSENPYYEIIFRMGYDYTKIVSCIVQKIHEKHSDGFKELAFSLLDQSVALTGVINIQQVLKVVEELQGSVFDIYVSINLNIPHLVSCYSRININESQENDQREIPKDIQKLICLYLCDYYKYVGANPKTSPKQTLEAIDQNTPTLK